MLDIIYLSFTLKTFTHTHTHTFQGSFAINAHKDILRMNLDMEDNPRNA